jgi:DNA mismatch repair protein MutL
MTDVIKLLPDSVANQIAAGEVIQRPASVVKELVENAIDAGADKIQIIIKDAGRTLIQIVDNGHGMSPTDARLAFERHATSKINDANDLFMLTTLGFRGEALASIAAVASVELKTKRETDEVGSIIKISGSKIDIHEQIACADGSNFLVKNLFYNVPARRKFLKTDQTEYRYILNEINRIILTNSHIGFTVVFDGKEQLVLKKENVKQRIINVFGKKINENLISISSSTAIININGYISKPERTRKTNSEQYFFVNNRYMYHPYFRKAVTMAYEKLIPEGEHPSFFIYFEINPEKIDVNIHPTKTEIKFEDEQAVFQILNSCVKESLGKFNVFPRIDFEDNTTRDAHLTSSTIIRPPKISVNPEFNPFDSDYQSNKPRFSPPNIDKGKSFLDEDFEMKPKPHDEEESQKTQHELFEDDKSLQKQSVFFQFKKKYIITAGKTGLIIIDQSRAHEKIIYDRFLILLKTRKGISQKSLFPEEIELNNEERAFMLEIIEDLNSIGFDIALKGSTSFIINGIPGDLPNENPTGLVMSVLGNLMNTPDRADLMLNEKIAMSLAKATRIKTGYHLSEEEMSELFHQLMLSPEHKYTPDGYKIIELVTLQEIENKFK